MRPGRLLPALLGLALGPWACASATRVQVRSDPATNDGRSFYMLVRTVDGEQQVVAEGYDIAAERVFTRLPQEGLQERRVVIPGVDLDVDLDIEEPVDVVLYFFFTRPGDRWWVKIDKKRLPAEIVVELGRNEVVRLGVRRQ